MRSRFAALFGQFPPDRTSRQIWLEASLVGLLVCLLRYAIALIRGETAAGDFQGSLNLAGHLLAGREMYDFEPSPLSIPYPMPAALVSMVLLLLPSVAAGCVFLGLSTGALAAGFLKAREDWRLLVFLAWNAVYAFWWVQWSFAISALWYFPYLSFLALVKPHVTLPVILAGECGKRLVRFDWKWILPPVVFLILSFVLYPNWVQVWLAKVGPYQGKVPPLFSLPFGPLILLALIAWRDRRCWLILGMACMPQRMLYDQLPLMFVANRPRELALFIATSWVNFAVYRFYYKNWDHVPFGWQSLIIATTYMPMVCVLIWPAIRGWISSRREPAP